MVDEKNNYILIVLGVIALIADVITVGHGILSGLVLNFWSFSWIMTVIFVFLLLGIGVYLFYIGSQKYIFESLLITFGFIYVILSLVLYIHFGYNQLKLLNSTADFFACVLLLFLLSFVGISFMFTQSNKIILYISYLYGLTWLAFVLMVGYKYVFLQEPFSFLTFSGEIIIIFIGWLLFSIAYFVGDGRKNRPDYVLKYMD